MIKLKKTIWWSTWQYSLIGSFLFSATSRILLLPKIIFPEKVWSYKGSQIEFFNKLLSNIYLDLRIRIHKQYVGRIRRKTWNMEKDMLEDAEKDILGIYVEGCGKKWWITVASTSMAFKCTTWWLCPNIYFLQIN